MPAPSPRSIACNSPLGATDDTTNCAISENSVTAGGTIYGDAGAYCNGQPPVGIVVTGLATADVDSNSVSGVHDAISECPEAGETSNDGIGIGLIPNNSGATAGATVVGINETNNPSTGDGNKLSGNDEGIVVSAGAAGGSYQINGNTVSSATQVGIALSDIGYGAGTVTSFEANSVSGVLEGAGIALQGTRDTTVGGAIAADGNSSTGNGVGLALTPDYCYPTSTLAAVNVIDPDGSALCQVLGGGAPALASDGNVVDSNNLSNNALYGLLKVGPFQPEEIQEPSCVALSAGVDILYPPNSSASNHCSAGSNVQSANNGFNDNTWTGNGTAAPLANGANVMDGTGWGGGCGQEGFADCTTPPTSQLTFEGSNTTFPAASNTTPFTLTVCNPSTTPLAMKAGTELTFYDENAGLSGTFFNTSTTIIQPNGTSCSTLTYPFTNLSVQALNPAKIGTDTSPTGQSYILGTGAGITINVNGGADVPNADTYGTGATANSCTPDDTTAPPATANIFGTVNGTGHPSSATLDAGTGGVNATYDAC